VVLADGHQPGAPGKESQLASTRESHPLNFTPDEKIQKISETFSLDAIDILRNHIRITPGWSDANIQHIEHVVDEFHSEAEEDSSLCLGVFPWLMNSRRFATSASSLLCARHDKIDFGHLPICGVSETKALNFGAQSNPAEIRIDTYDKCAMVSSIRKKPIEGW
jgi:hypothetical protein